jgi:hypothetical protein
MVDIIRDQVPSFVANTLEDLISLSENEFRARSLDRIKEVGADLSEATVTLLAEDLAWLVMSTELNYAAFFCFRLKMTGEEVRDALAEFADEFDDLRDDDTTAADFEKHTEPIYRRLIDLYFDKFPEAKSLHSWYEGKDSKISLPDNITVESFTPYQDFFDVEMRRLISVLKIDPNTVREELMKLGYGNAVVKPFQKDPDPNSFISAITTGRKKEDTLANATFQSLQGASIVWLLRRDLVKPFLFSAMYRNPWTLIKEILFFEGSAEQYMGQLIGKESYTWRLWSKRMMRKIGPKLITWYTSQTIKKGTAKLF